MPDVKSLNTKPSFQRFRERRLTLENKGPERAPTIVETDARTSELITNFEKVNTKAKTILAEARKLAITRNVPVDPRDLDVRAAVVRQDPGSSGAFISFDLYERSIRYITKQREVLPAEVLDDLTGDLTADSHRVHTRLLSELEDITLDEAELLGSQILILFILKLLQMGLDNLDTGKQTGGKAPYGVEIASIAAGIAISIAAQQTYAGLNAKQIQKSLESVSGDIPTDQVNVDAAKKELQNSELFQAALKARKPSDYAIIVQYVDNFLNTRTEPGWETWQAMSLLHDSITWIDTISEQLQRYKPETEVVDRPRIIDPLLTQSVVIESSQNRQPLNIDENVYRLYTKNLRSVNRTIDKIAHILGGSFSIAEICCFVRWLELQDRELIIGLRDTFKVVQNTLEKLDSLGAANTFRANLSVSAAIHQSVMLLMQDLEQGFLKKVENWFLTNTEKWEELMKCELIDDVYTYITLGIDKIKGKLTNLLDRYLGYIEDQERRADVYLDTMGHQFHLRNLMKIIDQFLSFTGSVGGICNEDPDPTQLAQAAERIQAGLGPTVVVPTNGDPYSTVASAPVKLSTGKLMPSASATASNQTAFQAAQHICSAGNVDMNIVPFPRI